MSKEKKVKELIEQTKGFSPEKIIEFSSQEFGKRINFASSLGEEDQAITHMIAQAAPNLQIFTLDTGRLFQESYALIEKTQKRYPMPFSVYYPDTKAVENMVKEKGINLFYESVENRKICCGIRKVQPLQRALREVDAWICGLRRGQDIHRSQIEAFEWDVANQKIKVNPLAYWSLKQVHQYINENKLDINPLHEKGFISIGCASCTRAIKEGEDARAGRWWWEDQENKECGLHQIGDKKGNK